MPGLRKVIMLKFNLEMPPTLPKLRHAAKYQNMPKNEGYEV